MAEAAEYRVGMWCTDQYMGQDSRVHGGAPNGTKVSSPDLGNTEEEGAFEPQMQAQRLDIAGTEVSRTQAKEWATRHAHWFDNAIVSFSEDASKGHAGSSNSKKRDFHIEGPQSPDMGVYRAARELDVPFSFSAANQVRLRQGLALPPSRSHNPDSRQGRATTTEYLCS